jgi:uncharacterized protein YwgA
MDAAAALTKRQRTVLAALATEEGARFAPVQVQKLFFLIDENAASLMGGRLFAFEPYDYGPFDADVYREIDQLAALGFAAVSGGERGQRRYSLTASGHRVGQAALADMPDAVGRYMIEASKWVRSLSFAALVGSIYKAYPRMREKSIFRAT